MRRSIKITLLALGTVLGYGFAFHSMRYHHHHCGYGHDGHDGWCDHDGHGWRSDSHPAPSKPEAPAPQPKTEPPTPQ